MKTRKIKDTFKMIYIGAEHFWFAVEPCAGLHFRLIKPPHLFYRIVHRVLLGWNYYKLEK